jgi:hypothetical protein
MGVGLGYSRTSADDASFRTTTTTKSGSAWALRLVPALLVALAFVLQAAFAQPASAETGVLCSQTGIETIASDQPEYAPGSTVHITGTGYAPGCDVVVKVTRPDGSVVKGDGSFEPGSDTVTTGLLGELSYDYQLQSMPAVPGVYAVDALGMGDAVLAQMTFADAFGLSRLRLGSAAGAENYMYTVGDVIYPEGDVDNSKWYRLEVRDASNVLRSSFACTPTSSFSTTNNSYTIQSSDPVSTSADYMFKLTQFNNNTCTSVDKGPASQVFEVAKATIYSTSSLTTQRSSFTTGETAYVVVAGVQQSKNNYDARWVKPDATTSCENTGGNDRPDTNANGVIPGTAGGFLQYRPTSTGDDWNLQANYDAACAAFDSTNQGTWKLRLQMDAKHFVTLTVFSVDTAAPTVTINQASAQVDPTHDAPIHFTAVFNEAVTGFSGTDVSFSGSTAGGTKTATVTEIAPNNGTTYDVSVTGITSRGTVVATIPAAGAQDGAGNGNTASASTDNTVTWDRVPTATVSLNDHSPRTNDTLTATATKNDLDSDAVSLTFVWKVNGVTKRTFSSPSALSDTFDLSVAGNGSKGDAVTVDVTPNDGLFDGTAAADSATIVNSAPSATVLLNDHSPKTNDTLTATASKADADGDAVGLTFVWKVNGVTKRTFSSPSALSDTFDLSAGGNGSKGDAVTVDVTPSDGTVNGTAAADLATVANSAPSVTLNGLTSAGEGGTNTYTFTTHDDDSDTLSFAGGYPTCGTGGSLQGSPVIGDGTFDCRFPDGPAGPVVAIKVTDGTAESNEATRSVSVANVAPSATLSNNGPVDEGSVATVSFSNQSDPSGADTAAGFHYAYSCSNGDLSSATYAGSGSSASTTCTYGDGPSDHTVKARIIDRDGGDSEYTTSVHVRNVDPTATLSNHGPVDEGSAATVSFSNQSDPSGADTAAGFHYAYSCSNGDLSGATYAGSGSSASTTCTYGDGPSDHTVKARIIDRDGGYSEYTTSVHVVNVDPIVTLTGTNSADEGQTKSYSYTTSDPGDEVFSRDDQSCGANGTLSNPSFDSSDGSGSFDCSFPDGHTFSTVSVTISDGDSGADSDSITVEIANVAPTATLANDGPVDEGSAATVSFSNQFDPSSADTAAGFHYAYSCSNGDLSGATYAGSGTSASHPCSYDDGPSDHTVKARIIDRDGGFSEYTTSVHVANVAPTATLANNGPIDEGDSATISFADQFDPSAADTAASSHYAYSCSNGDLSSATYAGSGANDSTQCSYDDGPSDHTVKARIIDQDGGFSEYTTSVHVVNVAPSVTIDGPSPVDEGTTQTYTFSVSDPGDDTFTVDASYPRCGLNGTYVDDSLANDADGGSFQCFFADGPTTTSVAIKVVDSDGATDTDSEAVQVVQVDNVAPTADLGNDGPVDEGSPATISFSNQFDPSGADTAAGFHYAYSCSNGDLSGATYANTAGSSASANCSFDDGPSDHTVKARIIDQNDGYSQYTTSVHVVNVNPTATLANNGPIGEGASATVSFSNQFDLSGADTAAGFHYAYSCSNGDLSGATYAGSGTNASADCSYDDGSSDHTVKARVIDRDGGYSEYTTSVHVANVAPTATLANDGPVDEGSAATISFSNQFDPSSADTAVGFHYAYSCTNGDLSGATYAGSSANASAQCSYDDGPSDHTVRARIIDRDGGFSQYTTSVHVANVAPTATLANNGPVDEGASATVSFSNQSDPSSADTAAGFHYAYSCSNGDLSGATYAGSGTNASATCTYGDGPSDHTVKARIIDQNDGYSQYTTSVHVVNVNPTATLTNNGPVDEGSPATISFSNQLDPSGADTAAGFHYAYSCANGDLSGATYAGSGTNASATCTYGDGPSDHTVKARIIDRDGGFSEYTTSVHVLNVDPTATLANNGPVDEVSPATISFSNQLDPSSADAAADFHYEYSCDGSAFGAVDYASAGAGAWHECTFDDGPSTHTVRARIIDKDNGFTSYTTVVTVHNVAPTATLSNNGPVGDGSTATISFSNQLDPSGADTAAGFHYAYSCANGDLSGATYAGSSTSAFTTCTYGDGPSNHTVRARIIDRDGGYAEHTTVVHVNDATRPGVSIEQAAGQADPTSASPIHFTAVFSEPVTGFDDSDVTVGGSANPSTAAVTDSGDHMTYDVAVSGMSSNGNVTASISAGTATDPAGNTNTDSASTDNQVAFDASRPQVSINQAAGQADPTSTSPIHFTAVFNEPVYGFGNGDMTFGGTAGGSKSASVSNPSNDHMTYDVAVSGMTTSGTVTVSIAADKASDAAGNGNNTSTSTDNTVTWQDSTTNAAPVVTITQPTFGQLYAKPATVNLSAAFTDADAPDTHTCSINWDDGSAMAGTISESGGSGTCTAQHVYNSAGVYTIVVTVSDNRGGSGTAEVMVVVYDASAGFVTGGGWITVQPGSYPAQPNLSGRANFGFNSQYKRGQNIPNGETEFQFQVANFNFHSTAYTWLVVSGYKAQYRGTGTVNGETGYNFLLTGYDGQVRGNGNTGVDRFRIKITRNGQTVFDNRMGSSEDIDSANPQDLGGGSIVIHSA